MDVKKARLLDQTLEMFRGDKTHTLEKIRNEYFKEYGNYDKNYPIENSIKFLLGEGVLREIEGGIIALSNTGFGVMGQIGTSYEKKVQKEIDKTKTDDRIRYVILFVTVTTFLILLYRTFILGK